MATVSDNTSKFEASTVIGIDVGGTFTDFAVAHRGGQLSYYKEPSTPDDPSAAVESGLKQLVAQFPELGREPVRVVHGTTIALNAMLQGKVAAVGLVVSTGMRDVLEIARYRTASPFNLHLPKPASVISRDRVFEIDARMTADGAIERAPDSQSVDRLVRQIQDSGLEAIAIALLNSYVSPVLEEKLAALIQARLPNLLISRSAAIWPEIREYERTVATCINAQIHPLMERYLTRLEGRLETAGMDALLHLSASSGGIVSVRSAVSRPIETMLSGPATGTTAAARVAKASGLESVLTFDMGGTSADIAVMIGGEVEFTTSAYVGEFPLMLPVVEIASIGAGGGSIISVDSRGIIKVGPESAGAKPGPVAYGLGGVRPTITDAYVVSGIIDGDNFLGGRMKLDVAAARDAMMKIASQLGLSGAEEAAEAALKVATARMATELFQLMALKGLRPQDQVLMPFGGAGPTHAVLLAEEAGLRAVAVPLAASTFCALGAAMADVRRDFVGGLGLMKLMETEDRLWTRWAAMEQEALAWLSGEGLPLRGSHLIHAADMRYGGQAHNLIIPVSPEARESRALAAVAEGFHRMHEKLYGFREPDQAVEIISQRLSVIGRAPEISLMEAVASSGTAKPIGARQVRHDGRSVVAQVYSRASIGLGAMVYGPAIVEQKDATLWVPDGWSIRCDPFGIVMIERRKQ